MQWLGRSCQCRQYCHAQNNHQQLVHVICLQLLVRRCLLLSTADQQWQTSSHVSQDSSLQFLTHSATAGARRGARRKKIEMKKPVTPEKIARLTDCSMMYTCQLLDLKGSHVFDQFAATAKQTTQNTICRKQGALQGRVENTVSTGDTGCCCMLSWSRKPQH